MSLYSCKMSLYQKTNSYWFIPLQQSFYRNKKLFLFMDGIFKENIALRQSPIAYRCQSRNVQIIILFHLIYMDTPFLILSHGLSSSPPHAHKISYTPLSVKLSFIISLSFHVSILLLVESATCAPVTKKQAKLQQNKEQQK